MANEKRLIYADSGKDVLEYMKKHICVGESDFLRGYLSGIEGLANGLAELPPVDAVEVVHGRCWLCEDYDKFVETVCYLPNDNGGSTTIPINYCPNCGATMDLE